VRSPSWIDLCFVGLFEGVCGAGALERRTRNLLYSLYFCASDISTGRDQLVARLRTDFGICLDVIASCLSAVILSSECLLPCFQILSECIASLLVVCDTHNDLCRACQDEMDVERSPITSKITRSRFYALRVHATQAKQGSSALPPKQAQSVEHHQRFFHLIESRPAKHRIYCT